MKKSVFNAIINVLAFTSFALLVTTGLMLAFNLPHGQGNRMTVWGLTRHGWGDVHWAISLTFLGLMFVHLLLHAPWIQWLFRGSPRKPNPTRLAIGLGATAAILGLCAAMFFAEPVVHERGGGGGGRGHGHDDHAVLDYDEAATVAGAEGSVTSRASS